MLDKLKEINNRLIKIYQNNSQKLEKQLIIQKILQEEDCFFKMDVELAYSILRDLQIPDEELKKIYLTLI